MNSTERTIEGNGFLTRSGSTVQQQETQESRFALEFPARPAAPRRSAERRVAKKWVGVPALGCAGHCRGYSLHVGGPLLAVVT